MENRVIMQLREAAFQIETEVEIEEAIKADEAYVKDKSRAATRKQEFKHRKKDLTTYGIYTKKDVDLRRYKAPEIYGAWKLSKDESRVRYPKNSHAARCQKRICNKKTRAEGKALCRV